MVKSRVCICQAKTKTKTKAKTNRAFRQSRRGLLQPPLRAHNNVFWPLVDRLSFRRSLLLLLHLTLTLNLTAFFAFFAFLHSHSQRESKLRLCLRERQAIALYRALVFIFVNKNEFGVLWPRLCSFLRLLPFCSKFFGRNVEDRSEQLARRAGRR